jgi:hypothetical protein
LVSSHIFHNPAFQLRLSHSLTFFKLTIWDTPKRFLNGEVWFRHRFFRLRSLVRSHLVHWFQVSSHFFSYFFKFLIFHLNHFFLRFEILEIVLFFISLISNSGTVWHLLSSIIENSASFFEISSSFRKFWSFYDFHLRFSWDWRKDWLFIWFVFVLPFRLIITLFWVVMLT